MNQIEMMKVDIIINWSRPIELIPSTNTMIYVNEREETEIIFREIYKTIESKMFFKCTNIPLTLFEHPFIANSLEGEELYGRLRN